ncbi:MAG: nucleotidyltransferase family protein [Blastocatellales bacterium]
MSIPRREEVLDVLRHEKDELANRYGVITLGVFGSVARDEAREESDVDVVITMRQPDLFAMVHIKDALEEALHRKVDIVRYREGMNQFLKKRIDQEAVYV